MAGMYPSARGRPALGSPVVRRPRPLALGPDMKNSGVAADDRIRILRPSGVRLYRDGMTVRQFLDATGDAPVALRQLFRSHRAGLIGFRAGRVSP